jgi:hypothetical protein
MANAKEGVSTTKAPARSRYGYQYWATILILNLIAIAVLKAPLDRVLLIDGLIVAVFGVAAIAKWSFRRASN